MSCREAVARRPGRQRGSGPARAAPRLVYASWLFVQQAALEQPAHVRRLLVRRMPLYGPDLVLFELRFLLAPERGIRPGQDVVRLDQGRMPADGRPQPLHREWERASFKGDAPGKRQYP